MRGMTLIITSNKQTLSQYPSSNDSFIWVVMSVMKSLHCSLWVSLWPLLIPYLKSPYSNNRSLGCDAIKTVSLRVKENFTYHLEKSQVSVEHIVKVDRRVYPRVIVALPLKFFTYSPVWYYWCIQLEKQIERGPCWSCIAHLRHVLLPIKCRANIGIVRLWTTWNILGGRLLCILKIS